MRGAIPRVGFGVWLGCFTAEAAQLLPDVMVDKYLLQAKMLSEEKDHAGALEAMDQIVSLQKKHDLTLPEEFSFQYAQTAQKGLCCQVVTRRTSPLPAKKPARLRILQKARTLSQYKEATDVSLFHAPPRKNNPATHSLLV